MRKKGLLRLALGSLVVVGHLETSSSEATLDVEALVCLAAVENALVASNLLSNEVESLDEPKTQLLALLVLGDCDILNVADRAEAVDELVLNNQGAGCDNRALSLGGVLNDNDIVAASSGHVVILLDIVGLAELANGCENAQTIEESAVVIGLFQSTQFVAFGKGSDNLRREEFGTEEAFRHGGVGLAGLEGLKERGVKGLGSTSAKDSRDNEADEVKRGRRRA